MSKCAWTVRISGIGFQAVCQCGWEGERSWPVHLHWIAVNDGRRHCKATIEGARA